MPTINATNFPYNLQNITGGGDILAFVQNVNDLTGQTFMLGMLLAGWIIMFVSMRSDGTRDALIASSFMIAVMSIFFRTLEFITTAKTIIILIIFAFIFVITMYRKD